VDCLGHSFGHFSSATSNNEWTEPLGCA
jgi:hypothetical protein